MRSVLVVSGGGFQGLGLLETLQQIPDVRTIVADIHKDSVTRYLCADYCVVPPLADRDAFSGAIDRLVATYAVKAIFPATARELSVLAGMREQLEDLGADVAVSSPELVDVLLDKEFTATFLDENALPAQALVDPEKHDFSFPLFGKPRRGWGGMGTTIARSGEDVRRARAHPAAEPMIWVPFVESFEEYSIDFAIARSRALSPLVIRRRIRSSGGFAVISASIDDPALHVVATAAATALGDSGGRGIFNVQLIRPREGGIFVSDINPRFGTSAVHGLAEGVNLCRFFIDGGRHDANGSIRTSGAKTIRYLRTIALPQLASRPDGIVFDLDDTLVDHKRWMATKLRGAYAAARGWIDEDEFMLHALQMVDEGERAHLIDRIVGHFGWSETRHAALLAAYRSATVPSTPLYADVAPVLASLRDAGFKLCVLTDNPPATQRSKMDQAVGLEALSVVYARETGAEKPSAAAFAAAATALALAPTKLCMVGDNYFRDALGAIRSGYADAFVLERRGAFLQPHAAIADLAPGNVDRSRIHFIDSLVALRETLLPA